MREWCRGPEDARAGCEEAKRAAIHAACGELGGRTKAVDTRLRQRKEIKLLRSSDGGRTPPHRTKLRRRLLYSEEWRRLQSRLEKDIRNQLSRESVRVSRARVSESYSSTRQQEQSSTT